MKVLDLDMDYFLDHPVFRKDVYSTERVDDIEVINSVWEENRVRTFLENNLGLSKKNKKEGRIVQGHDGALFFWKELIDKNLLRAPFSVVHIDSHSDLGLGSETLVHVLDEMIYWDVEYRIRNIKESYDLNGQFHTVNCGDYLLYALAYRWVLDLTYCMNPRNKETDIPQQILLRNIPSSGVNKEIDTVIRLNPIDGKSVIFEPEVPLKILPKLDLVKYMGDFDYVLLAQSPNYTPSNADYIMDVFKDYIIPI